MSNWTARAACKGMPTDFFFPREGSAAAVAEVRAICLFQCPVRDECLTDAFKEEASGYGRFGVRGALSSRQRRSVAAGRDIADLELHVPVRPARHAIRRAVAAGHTIAVIAEASDVSFSTISAIHYEATRRIVTLDNQRKILAGIEKLCPEAVEVAA